MYVCVCVCVPLSFAEVKSFARAILFYPSLLDGCATLVFLLLFL